MTNNIEDPFLVSLEKKLKELKLIKRKDNIKVFEFVQEQITLLEEAIRSFSTDNQD